MKNKKIKKRLRRLEEEIEHIKIRLQLIDMAKDRELDELLLTTEKTKNKET